MIRYLGDNFFDPRSLALYRLGLALIALFLVCRLCALPSLDASASVFALSHAKAYQFSLKILTVLALLAFFLGYATRYTAAISWFMVASLAHHTGSDAVASIVTAQLFIAALIPMGNAFSIDAAMSEGASPDHADVHLGNAAPLQNLTLLIWAVVLVYGVISMYPLWLLLCVPFLPRQFWTGVRSRVNTGRHAVIIYYDEPCGFCRKICFLFRTFLLLGDAQIRAAQTQQEVLDIMRQHDSWVVYDEHGEHYIEWSAMLLLMRYSPLLAPLGYFLTWTGMAVWGRFIYRFIAWSRNFLSRLSSVLLPYKTLPTYGSGMSLAIATFWFLSVLVIPSGVMLLNTKLPAALKIVLQYVGGVFH